MKRRREEEEGVSRQEEERGGRVEGRDVGRRGRDGVKLTPEDPQLQRPCFLDEGARPRRPRPHPPVEVKQK